MEGDVVILTSWGRELGTGHIQRTTTLLCYLAERGIDAKICVKSLPEFFPDNLKKNVINSLPGRASLLIRDMRDSTPSEISSLKRIAPLVAVDDLGEGREMADSAIDLLPNVKAEPAFTPFIYGYNFFSSVKSAGPLYEKTFDGCIYSGFGGDDGHKKMLISLYPDDAKIILFDGRDSFLISGGSAEMISISPFEALARSKTLVTHFGLMLYEGLLCRNSMITVNPTEYHEDLTLFMKEKMALYNSGVYPDINISGTKARILRELDNEHPPLETKGIEEAVIENLDIFWEKIKIHAK